MYKIITKVGNIHYNEVSQPNPLRWRILFKEGEEFHTQSGLIKCRDFFNDLVAKKMADKNFAIYGFDNSKIEFNTEGLYFQLSQLSSSEQFAQSVEKAINPKIVEQFGEEGAIRVLIQDKTSVIVLIPTCFFQQTYRISAITMMLRAVNYPIVFNSWEEIFKGPWASSETTWNSAMRAYVETYGFLPPEKTKDYWHFFTYNINNKETKNLDSHYIHNCGVASWLVGCNYGK